MIQIRKTRQVNDPRRGVQPASSHLWHLTRNPS